VDDVTLTDPLLDAAEVLGRLVLFGLNSGPPGGSVGLVDRFRRAYLAQRGETVQRLAAFEAAALVRLACGEVERDPESGTAGHLLTIAGATISRTESECPK